MEQKALKLIMAGLLILSMALTGGKRQNIGAMHAVNALRETGMGADDSGDSAWSSMPDTEETIREDRQINGAPEKDINLQIAQN